MQISKTRNLLKLRLFVLVLLALSVLLIIFFPRPGGKSLDSHRSMYARGEYQLCIDEITKLLRSSPEWDEARELLIQVELTAGQPVAALKSLMYWLESGQESLYDRPIMNMLIAAEPDVLDQGRALLEARLAEQPELDALRKFLIELEIAARRPDKVMPHLIFLAEQGAQNWGLDQRAAQLCAADNASLSMLDQVLEINPGLTWAREMKLMIALELGDYQLSLSLFKELHALSSPAQDLVTKTWFLAIEQDLIHGLDFALFVDDQNLVQEVLKRVEIARPDQLKETLPGLLELLPHDPQLLAAKAFASQDPRKGLDIILDLENSGYQPQSPSYADKKILLLKALDQIKPGYLRHIPPEQLINLALDWREDHPDRGKVIADWLDANTSGLAAELDMLRQVLAFRGSPPQLIFSGKTSFGTFIPALDFSPDSSWLFSYFSASATQGQLVNLATHEEGVVFLLSVDTPSPVAVHTGWSWSPGGKLAVVGSRNREYYIFLSDPNYPYPCTEIPLTLPDADSTIAVLGWLDASTLVLESRNLRGSRIAEFNITTGEYLWQKPRPGQPVFTADGRMAWIGQEEGTLFLDLEGKVTSYKIGFDAEILDWYPDNSKLLLQGPSGACTLDLESGSLLNTELPPLYIPGNWTADGIIWGIFPFPKPSQGFNCCCALVTLNPETGALQYAGVTIPSRAQSVSYCAQGNLLALANEFGDILVYQIP